LTQQLAEEDFQIAMNRQSDPGQRLGQFQCVDVHANFEGMWRKRPVIETDLAEMKARARAPATNPSSGR
jgi:hypothetical protein